MPNDTNILLGRTPTASSSVAPYLPAKAVDGNKTAASNRWLAYKAPGWLAVDLGSPYVISRWAAYLLPHTTDPASSWPANMYGMAVYELQTSLDGVSWTKVDGVTGNAASFTDRTLAAPVTARYVRLWANTGITGNNQAVTLQELEVYGHPVSADLASLVVSGGSLVPVFAPGATLYTQQVDTSVTSVTVTPTAADSTATIKVNGTTVVSGQASAAIALGAGSTSISVVVTPVFGATKTYTVTVSKGASACLLSDLKLKAGFSPVNPSPLFSQSVFAYTVKAGTAGSLVVTPSTTVTGATMTVNGTAITDSVKAATVTLNGASTVINIVVSASGMTSSTYKLTVSKP
jgi:large repetitive protein